MQRRTLIASLGLAAAGLTAGWALDGNGQIIGGANAVEQTYGRGFFAGQPHVWTAGGGFQAGMIGFAVDHVAHKLDLDKDQEARLDNLAEAAAEACEQAKSDPAFDRGRIDALPLPEQLSAIRAIARKADALMASLETPLADFHSSLDAGQQKKLAELIKEHRSRRDQRGGWWHRRG